MAHSRRSAGRDVSGQRRARRRSAPAPPEAELAQIQRLAGNRAAQELMRRSSVGSTLALTGRPTVQRDPLDLSEEQRGVLGDHLDVLYDVDEYLLYSRAIWAHLPGGFTEEFGRLWDLVQGGLGSGQLESAEIFDLLAGDVGALHQQLAIAWDATLASPPWTVGEEAADRSEQDAAASGEKWIQVRKPTKKPKGPPKKPMTKKALAAAVVQCSLGIFERVTSYTGPSLRLSEVDREFDRKALFSSKNLVIAINGILDTLSPPGGKNLRYRAAGGPGKGNNFNIKIQQRSGNSWSAIAQVHVLWE